jgi:uncharacterized protein (DUF1778 family)
MPIPTRRKPPVIVWQLTADDKRRIVRAANLQRMTLIEFVSRAVFGVVALSEQYERMDQINPAPEQVWEGAP